MAGFIEVTGVEEEKTALRAKKHVSFKEGVKIWERGMQICEWNAVYLQTQKMPRDLCCSVTWEWALQELILGSEPHNVHMASSLCHIS